MNNTTDATQRPEIELFPEGFLALHNGLAEHLQQGRMTPSMLAVFIALQYQVDWSSGCWNGNAHRVHNALGGQLSLSQVRRTLARLEKFGYIKRFKKQGLIGNYFILINKYRVRTGEVKGMVLNAHKSATWDAPVYEQRSDSEVRCGSDAREMRAGCGSDACDMRLYQDVKDVQGDKDKHTSTSSTSTTAAAVDDADEQHSSFSIQNPPAADATSPSSDKRTFLLRQEMMWADEDINSDSVPFVKTTKHLEESYAMSLKYGERYFEALHYWLDRKAREDLRLGEDLKWEREISKTWTLKAFLDYGLLTALELTKPKSEQMRLPIPNYLLREKFEWIQKELAIQKLTMDEAATEYCSERLAEGAVPSELLPHVRNDLLRKAYNAPATGQP